MSIPGTFVYLMPDGTRTATRPQDGDLFTVHDPYGTGNSIEYVWDDYWGEWCPVVSSIKAPRSWSGGPPVSDGSDLDQALTELQSDPKCDCGTNAPRGQGHSSWCKIYQREF